MRGPLRPVGVVSLGLLLTLGVLSIGGCSNENTVNAGSPVCRPGSHCQGTSQVEVCSEDGLTLLETRSCSAAEACEDGECRARACTPSATYCKDGARIVCAASGATEAEWPCEAGQRCVGDGQCVDQVCEPSADFCEDSQPRRCAADGVSSTPLGEACLDSTCVAGACEAWVCEPAADYCEGDLPSRCTADGLSSTPLSAACSGELPHCQFGACEGVLFADYEGYARWPLPGTPGHPFSYTVNAAAKTVVDNVTGLEWQREPAAEAQTWEDAVRTCESLSWGGRHDWRLPTRMELLTLVDYTHASPAIDAATFPGTLSLPFWTASVRSSGQSAGAWYVDFTAGITQVQALETASQCAAWPRRPLSGRSQRAATSSKSLRAPCSTLPLVLSGSGAPHQLG